MGKQLKNLSQHLVLIETSLDFYIVSFCVCALGEYLLFALTIPIVSTRLLFQGKLSHCKYVDLFVALFLVGTLIYLVLNFIQRGAIWKPFQIFFGVILLSLQVLVATCQECGNTLRKTLPLFAKYGCQHCLGCFGPLYILNTRTKM